MLNNRAFRIAMQEHNNTMHKKLLFPLMEYGVMCRYKFRVDTCNRELHIIKFGCFACIVLAMHISRTCLLLL